MQNNHAKNDQFYQKCHNSCFITPMRLKFVPKFTRLIYLQLSCFEFLLEMSIWPSNNSFKLLFNRNYTQHFPSSSLKLCFIHDTMLMDLETIMNQLLTCISMHERHYGITMKLKMSCTYLRPSSTRKNSDFELHASFLLLSFLLFSYLFFLSCLELSLSLFSCGWPKMPRGGGNGP